MRTRTCCRILVGSLLCWTLGCGPRSDARGAQSSDGTPEPAPITGARSVPTAAIDVQRTGTRTGFYPVTLASPVSAVLPAGETWSTSLPISASASAAWVSLTAQATVHLTSGPLGFLLEKGKTTTLLLPLNQRVLSLTASTTVALSLRLSGVLDQSGGGWTVLTGAAAFERALSPDTSVALPFTAADKEPTWYTAQVTGVAKAGQITFRACDALNAFQETWDVTPNIPLHRTVVLPGIPSCVSSTATAVIRLQPLARLERYNPLRWQRTVPTDIANTQTGAGGWLGRPNPQQMLRVSLPGLPATARAAVLHVTAERGTEESTLEVRGCNHPGVLATVPLGGTPHPVVLPLGQDLCLTPNGRLDVQATLVALLETPEGPLSCPPVSPETLCTTGSRLQRLQCLPGIQASEVSGTYPEGAQRFDLTLEQPVNHFQPQGAKLRQRIRLYWVDDNAPTVLHTTGYGMMDIRSELASVFRANELIVEHRFFASSTPSIVDWTQLNIVQSAFDSHRIVEQLKVLLRGTWISTGHSKGGMTAIFHRRFFPCDVDGSAPYVAPISFQVADPRYGTFMQTVGGPELTACRDAFFNIDRYLIRNIDTFARRMSGQYTLAGNQRSALYTAVGSLMWSFFQYEDADNSSSGCPSFEAAASTTNGLSYWASTVAQQAQGFSDGYILESGPGSEYFGYTYQTVAELGNQDLGRQHVAELGPLLPRLKIEELSFGNLPIPQFDPAAMGDIRDWFHQHSERFLLIYGARDPWTGGALELGNSQDSLKFTAPKSNHGATIADLSPQDRERALQSLERWLKTTRKPQNARLSESGASAEPPFIQFRDRMREYRL